MNTPSKSAALLATALTALGAVDVGCIAKTQTLCQETHAYAAKVWKEALEACPGVDMRVGEDKGSDTRMYFIDPKTGKHVEVCTVDGELNLYAGNADCVFDFLGDEGKKDGNCSANLKGADLHAQCTTVEDE